ncbi:MAG: phosphatase PAP2/dual specificity phosphatase family protein [Rubripirellula sp.]
MNQSESLIADTVSSDRVSFADAAKVALVTSALFLVFYGGASYATSLRTDVGTWYYDWERWVPFVPIMIVPYMSIDLFFVAAPFLCRDRKELQVLALRLSAVVIGAAVCFLLFPLQLAVERPIATGFFGGIYNWFTAMDRPYNLCPSMHIALRTVLAVHFAKHIPNRLARFASHFWFFLIGCSTLLLYQHHVIDVVGGFVLAIFVMHFVDGRTWKTPHTGGRRFAIGYGMLAIGFALPVVWIPTLGWLTLWPAVACMIVAAGYAWLGPSVYRREAGQISWPAKIVLGPVLAAQWLSWKYYSRQSAMIDHVADGVWIGRHLTDAEASDIVGRKVSAVIDVCNAFDEPESLRRITRLELPILDLTAPTSDQLDQAVDFITQHHVDGVLVHCKAGYSRSVAIVAAWLIRTERATSADDAFEMIRTVRPAVVIRPEIRRLFQSN